MLETAPVVRLGTYGRSPSTSSKILRNDDLETGIEAVAPDRKSHRATNGSRIHGLGRLLRSHLGRSSVRRGANAGPLP
jgi:hypothetical protein